MARMIDADALQELCNKRIQDTWNNGTAPVSWAAAYADFKDDIDSMPTLTQPNEPLTLEELSLCNDPVWIKRIGDEDLSGDGWAIVEGPRCLTWHNRIPVSWEIQVWWPGSEVEDCPKYENYNKTWTAYRRPKEEQ